MKTLRDELRMLDEPTGTNGSMNLTYADGYYAKSLERKYGKSMDELRAIADGKQEPKPIKYPRQHWYEYEKPKDTGMKQPTIQIPKFIEVAKEAEPVVADAEAASAWVDALEIVDNDSLELAVQMVAEVKNKNNEVNEKLQSFVGPLKGVIADLVAFLGPAISALDSAEKTIKEKISTHVKTSLVKRDEVLEHMSVDDTTETKETALARAQGLTPKKIPGMSIREGWTGSITHMEAFLVWAVENKKYEFIAPNEKSLKAYAKAMDGKMDVPGWAPKKTSTVAITVAKVK